MHELYSSLKEMSWWLSLKNVPNYDSTSMFNHEKFLSLGYLWKPTTNIFTDKILIFGTLLKISLLYSNYIKNTLGKRKQLFIMGHVITVLIWCAEYNRDLTSIFNHTLKCLFLVKIVETSKLYTNLQIKSGPILLQKGQPLSSFKDIMVVTVLIWSAH